MSPSDALLTGDHQDPADVDAVGEGDDVDEISDDDDTIGRVKCIASGGPEKPQGLA